MNEPSNDNRISQLEQDLAALKKATNVFIEPKNTEKSSLKGRIEVFGICMAIVFGVCTLILGTYTCSVYERQNRLSALAKLYDIEMQIYQHEMDNSNAMLVYCNKGKSLAPVAYLREILKAVTVEKKADDIASEAEEALITEAQKCATVDELYKFLWDDPPFASRYKHQLRCAHDQADMIFYAVELAYHYKNKDMISDEDWNQWLGYIREIGPNPFLLTVIKLAKEKNFTTREFMHEVEGVLKSDDDNNSVLQALAPDFFTKDWYGQWPRTPTRRGEFAQLWLLAVIGIGIGAIVVAAWLSFVKLRL